ncbi:MAG: hypothetical protein HZB76_05915 [Chlamydiae bacterium]|nr:hypothetical protein [Chlamydiota bacterium]
MSSQVLFNTNIFNSYEKFQNYMSGKDEIKAIQAQDTCKANIQVSLAKKIAMVIKAPFNLIAELFFSICSFFLSVVQATNLSVRCKILSAYFSNETFRISMIFSFDKDILVLSKNMLDPSTSDLYLTKKLERKFISKDERLAKLLNSNKMDELIEDMHVKFKNSNQNDPFVKTTFEECNTEYEKFNKDIKDIDFGHISGLCFGMSVWFAYLYLNSEQSSQDCLKHIVAVAKQFENGAPRQAGLLQNFFSRYAYFNNIKKLLKLQSEESIIKDFAQSHIFFNKMENGVYLMSFYYNNDVGHTVCFIKEGEHKYIFDPNVGLLNIDDEKTFQSFYNFYNSKKYHRIQISKLMKEAPLIQVPKKPSEVPKGVFFRIVHKISYLFSKKAA